uniref:Uncharacterized protein n=1 Tax=Pithovirus LCPAC104 TaxID=2506589 RepID=A0A481Z566_9VIRU|nr:MAG: uncharacterized protein LCPAC104_01620 [Pithovirus LCPAC104]
MEEKKQLFNNNECGIVFFIIEDPISKILLNLSYKKFSMMGFYLLNNNNKTIFFLSDIYGISNFRRFKVYEIEEILSNSLISEIGKRKLINNKHNNKFKEIVFNELKDIEYERRMDWISFIFGYNLNDRKGKNTIEIINNIITKLEETLDDTTDKKHDKIIQKKDSSLVIDENVNHYKTFLLNSQYLSDIIIKNFKSEDRTFIQNIQKNFIISHQDYMKKFFNTLYEMIIKYPDFYNHILKTISSEKYIRSDIKSKINSLLNNNDILFNFITKSLNSNFIDRNLFIKRMNNVNTDVDLIRKTLSLKSENNDKKIEIPEKSIVFLNNNKDSPEKQIISKLHSIIKEISDKSFTNESIFINLNEIIKIVNLLSKQIDSNLENIKLLEKISIGAIIIDPENQDKIENVKVTLKNGKTKILPLKNYDLSVFNSNELDEIKLFLENIKNDDDVIYKKILEDISRISNEKK